MMNETRQPTTTLEDQRIPVRAKLAAAWTSLMFLVIYIDYFHLYQPGEIDDIRGGVIFELDISGTLMSIFFAIIAIPTLMILLSTTAPAPSSPSSTSARAAPTRPSRAASCSTASTSRAAATCSAPVTAAPASASSTFR